MLIPSRFAERRLESGMGSGGEVARIFERSIHGVPLGPQV